MCSTMKTAQGRTVSTYSDPSQTENGPCCIQEDHGYHIIRQVAAKIVEDVVMRAAVVAEAATRTIQEPEPVKPFRGPCLQRLPTIQIDTVPSMPPSPTDWPPPPDDIMLEENEPVDQGQIEIEIGPPSEEPGSSIFEEIKKFAASYVQDILFKAISLTEEKFVVQESAKAREMAEQMVEEVITKATETAREKLEQEMFPAVVILPSSLSFPGLPTIQIDTVASMPPSPTDWPEDKADDVDFRKAEQPLEKRAENQMIPGITIDEPEDDLKGKMNLLSYIVAPEELREFAAAYVKDVISRAISLADEKMVPTVPFNFEDVDLMKTSGPWYIRAREALMRVLRIACFCTPRRNDS